MTIPLNNWCNDCQEACHGHTTICTVCGAQLGAPPPRVSGSSNGTNDAPTTVAAGTAGTVAALSTTQRTVLGDVVMDDMRQASQDLREILRNLQGQVRDLNSLTRNIVLQQQQLQERQQQEWQAVPAHIMDLTAPTKSRATSEEFLANIPRIVLTEQSTLLRQATLQVTMPLSSTTGDVEARRSAKITESRTFIFSCVLGEFGPTREYQLEGLSLVMCSPITGKGGLSNETKAYMSDIFSRPSKKSANNNGADYVVAFMQRGDGLTFVEKALMAQRAGASAVIVGNTTSSSWPYVMQDSKGEAEENGLMIPVAMIKESDSKLLLDAFQQQKPIQQQPGLVRATSTGMKNANCCSLPCNLHIAAQARDCAVCCEALETSERVIQIPRCGHIFHEGCAMRWLESHNTCPFCRLELPTDDVEYEQERARRQRTHAGGTEADGATEWNQFYG